MSKGGSGKVEETSKERALADVGKQQLQDFKQRWLPVQKAYAKNIVAAGEPDSFQRRQAVAKGGIDTTFAFGKAADKLDSAAATSGAWGGSAQKLGITGMADDRATSSGLGTVAANSAVDDSYVSGLGSITALGRGEKAIAIDGMASAAATSGRQAAADAQQSAADRAGTYRLAATGIGLGAGAYAAGLGKPPGAADPNLGLAGAYEDPDGLGRQFNNPSAYINPRG